MQRAQKTTTAYPRSRAGGASRERTVADSCSDKSMSNENPTGDKPTDSSTDSSTDDGLVEPCEVCGGPVDIREHEHFKSPDERFVHGECYAEKFGDTVETDTKFVAFQAPEVGQAFRFMVTRFEPRRQSIPHGCGYVDAAYRQYTRIAQGSRQQVTDTDVYKLIDKLDEQTHHDLRESEIWAFLRWVDGVSWGRLPDQYRTDAGGWGEEA